MVLDAFGDPSYQCHYCHGHRMKFVQVDKHLSSTTHLTAVRNNVMMNQLNLRQPTMVQCGPSDMDLDHAWPGQDSFNTEMHIPQVIQREYIIRDDDDVGFGSESSGVHDPPSDYSEEYLSWEMFGDSIIAQRAEAKKNPSWGDTKG